MTQTHYDAIIIGAGPAGASAAILLAQAGWSVVLVEKQRFPRRKVCGECIAATNLSLIDKLGIGDAFAELAGPELRRVVLMSSNKTIYAELPALPDGKHRWGRALGREYLDTLLLHRAEKIGATIMQPWTASSIAGSPGQFQCEVSAVDSTESATLTAPVMIAAHGSWELLPSARETERMPHKPSDLFAFKANFRNSSLAAGVLPVLAFAGGYGGMVVGDHDITTLACCIRRDTLSANRKKLQSHTAAEAVEVYLKTACAGVNAALNTAQLDGAWLSVGPIRPGIRIKREGDIFLIGNAAGEAHPIIGEGISMAMQSAWLLCERLIANRKTLLDGTGHQITQRDYAAEWLYNFAPRIRLAALFAHIAMRPALTSAMFAVLQRWPAILTNSARWSGKVKPIDAAMQT